MKRSLASEYALVTLILFLLFVMFYFKYLTQINSFVMFSNWTGPLNLSQLNYQPIFYDKYQNFGISLPSPLGQIENSSMNYIFFLYPAKLFGMVSGEKIFVLVTSLIYGLSFFVFTQIFTKNFYARLISTVFFLFNPFSIQLYAYGDFQQFIFISLGFCGLSLLFRGIAGASRFKTIYIPFAALLIVLSFPSLNTVIVFLLFSLIIFAYAFIVPRTHNALKANLRIFLASFSKFVISLVFISLPFILLYLYSPVSFLPNSVSGFPVSFFNSTGINPLYILALKAYPPPLSWIISQQTFGDLVYNVWQFLIYAIVIFIFIAFIFLRDRRLAFISTLTLFFTFLAAETQGPLGILAVYLYEYLPGYQSLNFPYLWVWLMIIPLISIGIALIFSDIEDGVPEQYNIIRIKNFISKKRNLKRKSILTLTIILVIIMIIPISTQGYYTHGNVYGLGATNVPTWYNELDKTLVNITSANNSGVLFNTINSYYFTGNNTSDATNNLLQLYPQFTTVSLSSYIPDFSTVTNFFYWFYYELYTNQTKYSANLASLMGVQYFVDIYNANSVGYPYFVDFSYNVNASHILDHQTGWMKMVSTSKYSIFKNEYYNGNKYYASDFSLILGNYNTLNFLEYDSVNIQNITPIFPTDLINSPLESQIVNNVTQVVLDGNNSYFSLIELLSKGENIFPASYVNQELSSGNSNWINSERNYNRPDYSTLVPYAETTSNTSLNIPISVNHTGTYTIMLKLYFSNVTTQGGKLGVSVNTNSSLLLNTSRGFNGENNAFLWVNITSSLHKGKNSLSIHSYSGFNAISQIYVISQKGFSEAIYSANTFLKDRASNVVVINGALNMVPSHDGKSFYGRGVGSSVPNGAYISLNAGSKVTISSPVNLTGDLLINVISSGATATLNISSGEKYWNVGISPNIYNPFNMSPVGYITVPITSSRDFNISIMSNTFRLGQIVFLPKSLVMQSQIEKTYLGNVSYERMHRGIHNFTMSVSHNNNSDLTSISGNFSYNNVSYYYPVNILFQGDYYYNLSPVFTISSADYGNFFINGVELTTNTSIDALISPQLNDQYSSRPNNILLQFEPSAFNSSKTYNVSFKISFIGFSKLAYHNTSSAGQRFNPIKVESTKSGFKFSNIHSGFLVVRLPYMLNFVSSAKITPGENGLTTIIFVPQGVSQLYVEVNTYNLFMYSLLTMGIYLLSYIAVDLFILLRKRHLLKA